MAWKKNNPGCRCCKPQSCKFCVSAINNCTSANITGATVTVSKAGSPVASCITSGMLVTLTAGSPGTSYANGTGYALGIAGGGGSGATGTFDVVGGQVTNLKITAGGSGYTSAPAITFPGAGGSGATATATVRPQCCLEFPKGTYDLKISAPGFNDYTGTVDRSSCGTYAGLSLSTVRLSTGPFSACSGGTSSNFNGFSVQYVQGGVTVASGVLSGSGGFVANIPAGIQTTINITDTVYGRFNPGSFTSGPSGFTGCTAGQGVTMTLASGYRCLPVTRNGFVSCDVPASETLNLTNARYGVTAVLTYNPATGNWEGSGAGHAYKFGVGSGGWAQLTIDGCLVFSLTIDYLSCTPLSIRINGMSGNCSGFLYGPTDYVYITE